MLKLNFENPVVILAPMAGLTDAPTRAMVARFGVDAVVSEMLASQELKAQRVDVKTRAIRGELPLNTTFVVQIAGRDPQLMRDAALFACDVGADHVDINMGCPAKKVTNGQTAGASLLREPDLALNIIETVANAVSVPVTVKTRLGWDQHSTFEVAPKMVEAGAQLLTIHGRTRAQKYSGQADWLAVRRIVENVNVPVIVNGDIQNFDDSQKALNLSRASGVMVGRASAGRPWLISQIRNSLSGKSTQNTHINLSDVVTEHYENILSHYGETLGVRVARKHLSALLNHFAPNARTEILKMEQPRQVVSRLRRVLDAFEEFAA